MSAPRSLGDYCHARAGDKGDASILVLAPHDPADFPALVEALTAEAVAAHFALADPATVRIRPVPALAALTIVLPHRLEGGVTRSATIDPHGKTLSAHLLALDPANRAAIPSSTVSTE